MKGLIAITAWLLIAIGAGGCAVAARSHHTMTPPGELTLQPGTRAALPDGAWLQYLGVSNDSRCPPDVQCIQAGDADVRFRFEAAGGGSDVTLNTANATVRPIGRWQLRLLRLEHGPAPAVTVRVDAAP